MKTKGEANRRAKERLQISLPVRVRGRDPHGQEWEELSHLVDVSPFGARISLSRPIEPGRVLHLTMPLPRRLRSFDHAEDQYRVWSLARNIRVLTAIADAA